MPSGTAGTSARRARRTGRRWPALRGRSRRWRGLAGRLRPGARPVPGRRRTRSSPDDPEEALPLFAAARGRGNDRAIDLLEGISRYQLGEDARAVPLLESARADPALAESASFFLGLIALRRGDGDRASRLFDQAGHAMGLEDAARQLSRMAQLEGHLVLSALAEVVYDTNVALRPDGAPTTLPGPDGSVGLTLMALVRPWGTPGPYARVEGQLSKQFTLEPARPRRRGRRRWGSSCSGRRPASPASMPTELPGGRRAGLPRRPARLPRRLAPHRELPLGGGVRGPLRDLPLGGGLTRPVRGAAGARARRRVPSGGRRAPHRGLGRDLGRGAHRSALVPRARTDPRAALGPGPV